LGILPGTRDQPQAGLTKWWRTARLVRDFLAKFFVDL
jgi:hypothetical protein